MSKYKHKKPTWITVEAFEHLARYCEKTGETRFDVVSTLITDLSIEDAAEAPEKPEPEPKHQTQFGARPWGGVHLI